MAAQTSEPARASATKKKAVNDENLQAEVASFAASLGLIPGAGFDGFDDSDFRKSGPIAPKLKKKQKEKGAKELPADDSAGLDAVHTQAGGNKGKPHVVKGQRQQRSVETQAPGNRGKSHAGRQQQQGTVQTKARSNKAKSDADPDEQQGSSRQDRKRASPFVEAEGGVKRGKTTDTDKSVSRVRQFSSFLWYEAAAAAADRIVWTAGSSHPAQSGDQSEWEKLVHEKKLEGDKLLEKAASDHARSQEKDSDRRWVTKASKFGTSADKVAAMTVLLQDNPIANLRSLDALLGMVTSKGGKRHAVTGILALKELFLTNLLPERKLKYLSQQPLPSLPATKEGKDLLLYWCWEDSLKRRYDKFVSTLEEAAKDTLPILKEKAVKTVYDLLKGKPEQERRLLSTLVNKLGDPERKTASNASYMLSCLLSGHPNMKGVVIDEVDTFVFRPHVGLRARYYAVIFLNQIILGNRGDGPKLARRLVDLYFAMFKTLTTEQTQAASTTKQKGNMKGKQNKKDKMNGGSGMDGPTEVDSRLLSALLTGINRAFPFVAAGEVDGVVESHTPLLFRLVHSENLNIGVQALILIYQLLSKNLAMSDRFYRALYAVLLMPGLFKSSKVEMFIGLMFKAIKSDINSKRVAAFVKRLLQVSLQQPPQYACGSLLIVSEVLKGRPSLWHAILQQESNDEEDEHFVDLLDDNEGGAAATEDMQRGDQSSSKSSEGDDAASRGGHEGERSGSEAENTERADFDYSEEDDASSDDSLEHLKKRSSSGSKRSGGQATPRVVDGSRSSQVRPSSAGPVDGKGKVRVETLAYNPLLREPSYCNADQTCWWELTSLSVHVHPSVAAMARTLLSGSNVLYSGDPLQDFALGVFLDRFAEKKPKARKGKEGGTWHGLSTSKSSQTLEAVSTLPVGAQFLTLAEADVAPEDVVFHKFYQAKASSRGKSRKKQNQDDEEDDDITGITNDEDDVGDEDDSDNEEVEALLEREEGAGGMDSADDDDDDESNSSGGEFDYDKLDGVLSRDDGRDSKVGNDSDEESESASGFGVDGELVEPTLDSDPEMLGPDSEDECEMAAAEGATRKRKSRQGRGQGRRLRQREGSSSWSPFASAEEYSELLSDGGGSRVPDADGFDEKKCRRSARGGSQSRRGKNGSSARGRRM